MRWKMELDLFLGNGNVWYAGPAFAGLQNLLLSMCSTSGHHLPLLYWWSSSACLVAPGRGASPCGAWWVFSCPFGEAPAPEGQQGSSDSQSGWVHFSCAWLLLRVGFPPPCPSLPPLGA